MTQEPGLRRGALLMIVSAFFFAAMGLSVKLASRSLSNSAVVFFRNALGLLTLLPWLGRLGMRGLATRDVRGHLVRSLAGLASMYCFFYAIAHLRLADAVLLNYSLPLFMPFIARFWLREPIPPGLWRGLGLGFVGIALILKPGLELFNPVALVAIAAALLAALAQVGVRSLTVTEPTTRIVFYFSVISTAVSTLPLLGAWRPPPTALWPVLLAMGTTATLGQLFLTRAYASAPAAQVGPFIYAVVPFAAILEGVLLKQWLDPASMIGAVLVSGAGILTLRATPAPTAAPE
jgi:drug/metabolite transporter (DMT)-like permease